MEKKEREKDSKPGKERNEEKKRIKLQDFFFLIPLRHRTQS